MTIPLLMNCPHKKDSICLKCAKIEYDRYADKIEKQERRIGAMVQEIEVLKFQIGGKR